MKTGIRFRTVCGVWVEVTNVYDDGRFQGIVATEVGRTYTQDGKTEKRVWSHLDWDGENGEIPRGGKAP
jgi:hypothetical protein